MTAILHTQSGKKLPVDVQIAVCAPDRLRGKAVTDMFNDAVMEDRVIWTEIYNNN